MKMSISKLNPLRRGRETPTMRNGLTYTPDSDPNRPLYLLDEVNGLLPYGARILGNCTAPELLQAYNANAETPLERPVMGDDGNIITPLTYDKLIAVRAYSKPEDIVIRDGKLMPSPIMPTIHFSLNHLVNGGNFWNLENARAVLLVPFSPLVKRNKSRFYGGLPNDVFFVGPMEISGTGYSVGERPRNAVYFAEKIQEYVNKIRSASQEGLTPGINREFVHGDGDLDDSSLQEISENWSYVDVVENAIRAKGFGVEMSDYESRDGEEFFMEA